MPARRGIALRADIPFCRQEGTVTYAVLRKGSGLQWAGKPLVEAGKPVESLGVEVEGETVRIDGK